MEEGEVRQVQSEGPEIDPGRPAEVAQVLEPAAAGEESSAPPIPPSGRPQGRHVPFFPLVATSYEAVRCFSGAGQLPQKAPAAPRSSLPTRAVHGGGSLPPRLLRA